MTGFTAVIVSLATRATTVKSVSPAWLQIYLSLTSRGLLDSFMHNLYSIREIWVWQQPLPEWRQMHWWTERLHLRVSAWLLRRQLWERCAKHKTTKSTLLLLPWMCVYNAVCVFIWAGPDQCVMEEEPVRVQEEDSRGAVRFGSQPNSREEFQSTPRALHIR